MKTEELKSKIKELNDYFVEKLVKGEYEVKGRDKFMIVVNIDGYRFNIWIANGGLNVQTYGSGFKGNFMELFFSKEQKLTIYKNLTGDDYKISLMAEIENKEKEIERLKSKLNEL